MTEQYPGAVPPPPQYPQTPPAAPYQGAPQQAGGYQAPYQAPPSHGPYQPNPPYPNGPYQSAPYQNAPYQNAPQPYPGAPQNAPFQGVPVNDAERRRATRAIGVGAVLFVIGLLITVLTYSHASGSGGVYVVAWGPMLFGVIRMITGLVLLAKSGR
ncbi:hypothetical protein NE235_34505 [Actinoallomurus spadix]|uniref:Uncharacterized protein n=1 Tax=Actinoallomurus spadix TaxID=79912 RepID=A0ABP3G9S8_9ACTN|nr:hypothetical protein [Actinoallomurus spadix]MCO5991236.1 hypothetical protein [Actinoallomurus spadix]